MTQTTPRERWNAQVALMLALQRAADTGALAELVSYGYVTDAQVQTVQDAVITFVEG